MRLVAGLAEIEPMTDGSRAVVTAQFLASIQSAEKYDLTYQYSRIVLNQMLNQMLGCHHCVREIVNRVVDVLHLSIKTESAASS